ncbi:hypothetical protein UlMin_020398 [Ulmus minor]
MAYVSMGEVHRRITNYLNRLSDVVSSQDGTSLKLLFSLSSNSPISSLLPTLVNQSERFSQLGDIVLPLFHTLQNYRLGNSTNAYEAFEKSTNFFIQEFRNWDSAWALEALYVVAYQIRVLAERADRDLASNGKSQEKLKVVGSFLMKVFEVLAVSPKRVGALYVSCQLFKIYVKVISFFFFLVIVIRSIEIARIFEFEEFPKKDKVTYMYYTVHLEVFNKNFPTHHSYATKSNEYRVLVPMNWFLGFHHWSASGAYQLVVKDLKEEFVKDYIFPCFWAGAVYERKYLLLLEGLNFLIYYIDCKHFSLSLSLFLFIYFFKNVIKRQRLLIIWVVLELELILRKTFHNFVLILFLIFLSLLQALFV